MSTKLNPKRMEIPIVCDLSVFTQEERKNHIDESMDLFTNAKRAIEIRNGFAFHFDYSEKTFLRLADWMKDDTKCCPFLTFEVSIEPFASGKEAILRLTGNQEMKEGIRLDLEKMGIKMKPHKKTF